MNPCTNCTHNGWAICDDCKAQASTDIPYPQFKADSALIRRCISVDCAVLDLNRDSEVMK